MNARRPYLSSLALVVVAALTAACGDDGGGVVATDPTSTATATTSTPPATTSPTPGPTGSSPTATATATVSPTGTMTVKVYYLHDLRFGPRLQRETRTVSRTTGVVRAAVDAMLRLKPLDPDYTSLWPTGTRVLGASISGDTATVDLSAEARNGNAGGEAEEMSLQQLVWTVTEAAPTVRRVRLRIAGRDTETLWGHADTSRPLTRGDHSSVLAPISVERPVQGATVTRTFTLGGTANTFEANVQWRVTASCRPGTTCPTRRPVLASGYTTATAGTGTRGTWQVTVRLPATATEWVEVRAFESSAQDGSEQFADTKVVRVG